MRLAVDLHLHSRHSQAVSSAMTVENIARWAQAKGLDIVATGDALHADWLAEIEANTEEAEPGLRALRPEVAARVSADLPEKLRRPLRFVLSTEVCCAPPGTPSLGGLHHLVYFPSLEQARRFRERVRPYGDLGDGRPTLAMESWRLLDAVCAQGDDVELAPAHVFNPWYSSLGSVAGANTLAELFGEGVSRLLAVETGLTATPPMCRRVSALDRHALFSCSDAHSPAKLGRECTLLDLPAPGYAALMDALRAGDLAGTIKYPLERTRYYLNRCAACAESFDARRCPRCGHALVQGSRDRLEQVADRDEPPTDAATPPFVQLLPLLQLLAEQIGAPPESPVVGRWRSRLLAELGHERRVLTELTEGELAAASTPALARAIVCQRTEPPGRAEHDDAGALETVQLGLGL